MFRSARNRPSPIDAYFGGVYYIGPIFTAFRGTDEACAYYAQLRAEVEERIRSGAGPITPGGPLADERFRLVVEGPPNWTSFRDFWKIFYDEGAVAVASTYTQVGGMYERGFRHDPARPLESLAEYCLRCYTNLSMPGRVQTLTDMVEDYDADGFVVHSVKSCNSFSAGPAPPPARGREAQRRAGRVHRVRPGRRPLLRPLQHQEPDRVVPADAGVAAHLGADQAPEVHA